MIVAICTSDGINVDLHFGKTETFFIFKIEGGQKEFLEKRSVNKLSPVREFLQDTANSHEFDQHLFNSIYAVISDCRKIYTTNIGDVPRSKLKEKGIGVKICSCPIDQIPTCSGNCK